MAEMLAAALRMSALEQLEGASHGVTALLASCGVPLSSDQAPDGAPVLQRCGVGEGSAHVRNLAEPAGATLEEGGALEGRVVALYFSAHWCPPCRAFTPMLASFARQLGVTGSDGLEGGARKPLEVIFVSRDRTQAEFNEYTATMFPFLAVPFGNAGAREELARRFGVRGIPTLVLLAPDGSTITTEGRGLVQRDPSGVSFPYTPGPMTRAVRGALGALGNDGRPKVVAAVDLLLRYAVGALAKPEDLRRRTIRAANKIFTEKIGVLPVVRQLCLLFIRSLTA